MPIRSVARVVETLEFEIFDERFRGWARDQADAISAALEPRLRDLSPQEQVKAGELLLSTGNVKRGTQLIASALANAREEMDLRIALSSLSMFPVIFGPHDDLEIEVDVDRAVAFDAAKPFLSHGSNPIRRLARSAIRRLNLPEVTELQRQWLAGDDSDARKDAALDLGYQGDPTAWPVLKEHIRARTGGRWQAMVHCAAEICRKANLQLRTEIAEFGRDEIRARLHKNDLGTANEVLDLRRVVAAGKQPWHLDFIGEQLRAKTCFAEYLVGEWAWNTGPSAIPRLIEYLDDPVLSRGVIDYLTKTSNPRLGSSEEQAPLRARLE
ncbi:MAG: hypothetical protein AAFY60_19385, partial [Myxococcota bacterium]